MFPENVLLKELYVEPKSKQEEEVNRAIEFDNMYLGLIAPCHVQTSADRQGITSFQSPFQVFASGVSQ